MSETFPLLQFKSRMCTQGSKPWKSIKISQIQSYVNIQYFVYFNQMMKERLVMPDIFQLQEMPYLMQQRYPIHQWLTEDKLLEIRNFTHNYAPVTAKMYTYWSEEMKNHDNEKTQHQKMVVHSEIPIISAQNFQYLLIECEKKKEITNSQWQSMISSVKAFKETCTSVIRNQMQSLYRISFLNKQNFIEFNVYAQGSIYFLKAHLKSLAFQMSSNFMKKQNNQKILEPFVIQQKPIVDRLDERKQSLLNKFASNKYTDKQLSNFYDKYEQFYQEPVKRIDERILQLQVYHNFPNLRIKSFLPISFKDARSQKPLIGPILSNANKLCMFNHFCGYNEDIIDFQGQLCEICGIELRQFKSNFILQYLRDNLFNVSQEPILYCPQANRFKVINSGKKFLQNKLANLSLQSFPSPTLYNFMHLKINIQKLTPKIRNGLYKDLQQKFHVFFQFRGKKLMIRDPVRGKNCHHYSFTDLRLFYMNKAKQSNFKNIYICPICSQQTLEEQLLYLNEAVCILKFYQQLLFPEKTGYRQQVMNVQKQTMMIVINHKQKKLTLQYGEMKNNQYQKLHEKVVEGLYQKMTDPYVHFSEYRLGIKDPKKVKRNDHFNNGFDDDDERDKVKYQKDRNK